MRRTLLSLFSLLALASLLLETACSSGGSSANKSKATPTPLPTAVVATKPTYTVKRGEVTSVVEFSARVIPSVQEELYFRTDGRVRKVYVKGGDTVKKGQVLADLVSLDKMEIQSQQQALSLRKAQINYEMTWLQQQLWATQTSVWDDSYDIKSKLQAYQVELSQIALDEAKLQTTDLNTAITDSEIVATMDGKVLSMTVLEGDDVKAFDPKVTIGDDSQLELGSTLTAEQMQELAEKMPVTIVGSNSPSDKFTGTIRSLPYPYGTGGGKQTSASASESSSTKSTDTTTRIVLDKPDAVKDLRMGQMFDVTVVLSKVEKALWLPPAAIRSFEGRNFVVVKSATGQSSRTDVKVGIQNDDQVEIKSGLKEGQEVLAP